jgi:hypothetical protein
VTLPRHGGEFASDISAQGQMIPLTRSTGASEFKGLGELVYTIYIPARTRPLLAGQLMLTLGSALGFS